MAELRLFTFGPPRLERDGQLVDLNLRKAQALLVYLTVSAQPHSRDSLATLLWPDSDQREGRARLRRTLHRLNEALGDHILDSSPETIRLHPAASIWLDCAIFREHVIAGLPASTTHALAPERLAHLTTAIELYQADFLAGFTLPDSPSFDEWEFFQRESLRQLYGQVLEQLAQAYRANLAWDEAITYARRWVALDNLHEPAHRALMQLYALSGQQAAALRQYQECLRLLDAELGVTPEAETTALYESIHTRQLRPIASKPQPAQPIASQPPQVEPATARPAVFSARREDTDHNQAEDMRFVARQRELAWLDGMLRTALQGQHRVVFVLGEAGQGKSALLRAFAQHAQQAHPQLVVAGGNCNAYTGMGDPYLPFREILELLTGDVEARTAAGTLPYNQADRLWHTLRPTTQALLEVGPDLLDTFIPIRPLLDRVATAAPGGAPWVAHLEELANAKATHAVRDIQQQDLFEQYARVVQDVARRVPLLLLLDDLQWADQGSANLLFHLGRRLAGSNVLIVGAYRPADVALGHDGERHPLRRVVNEFQHDWGAITLDLADAEGQTLVEELIDSEPNQLDRAFRDMLYRQTGGHPLFTLELLRDMQERGDLVRDGEGRWTEHGQLDWTMVPARVEGAISERFSRLEPALQELLQVASVEGEEFTAELVAHVLGVDEREMIRHLSRDLDKTHRLVRAVETKREGAVRLSRYRFGHILIQQYVYHRLDEAEQVYFSEALGHALERMFGDESPKVATQLARFFEAAHLAEKAAVYLQFAGDQARYAAALDNAVRYYALAVNRWPQSDPAGRALLLRKLGECQWLTAHLQDALRSFESSFSLFEEVGDMQGAGATQRLIGRIYWEQGDREQSLQHYHRALALLEQGPETVELVRAISAISQMHGLAADYGQALLWGERALALAERLGAADVMVHALNTVGFAYGLMGEPKRGEALLRKSLRHALDLGLPYDTCRAYMHLGETLVRMGRYEEARATFEELQVYATSIHVPLFAGSALTALTALDWLAGRWKEALARREQIHEWPERSQLIGYLKVTVSTLLGWMYNDMGQPRAAHQILEQALPKARSQAEQQTTGPYLAQVARALILRGRMSEAGDVVRELLALIAETRDFLPRISVPLIFLGRWLANRPAPEALDDARAILHALERAHAQIGSPETEAALSEARGTLALSENNPLQAVEQLRQAATGWQTQGRPYDQARTLADLGRALAFAGDTEAAYAVLDQALKLIKELADQLEDVEIKADFLDSSLVREIHAARAAAESQQLKTAHTREQGMG